MVSTKSLIANVAERLFVNRRVLVHNFRGGILDVKKLQNCNRLFWVNPEKLRSCIDSNRTKRNLNGFVSTRKKCRQVSRLDVLIN